MTGFEILSRGAFVFPLAFLEFFTGTGKSFVNARGAYGKLMFVLLAAAEGIAGVALTVGFVADVFPTATLAMRVAVILGAVTETVYFVLEVQIAYGMCTEADKEKRVGCGSMCFAIFLGGFLPFIVAIPLWIAYSNARADAESTQRMIHNIFAVFIVSLALPGAISDWLFLRQMQKKARECEDMGKGFRATIFPCFSIASGLVKFFISSLGIWLLISGDGQQLVYLLTVLWSPALTFGIMLGKVTFSLAIAARNSTGKSMPADEDA